MNDDELRYTELSSQDVYDGHIFRVARSVRRAPSGAQSNFTLVKSPDWANLLAVVRDERGVECFLMVKQFRHGDSSIYWEFPGGMVEPGEDPEIAVARELREETGYEAQRLAFLGSVNPNPAFMTNRVHTYFSDSVALLHETDRDEGEYIEVGKIPVERVLTSMGTGEFAHGIMMIAVFWYQRFKANRLP